MFLDLKEINFSQLNKKQRIIIQIVLSSKENMLKYLYDTETLSSHEIFGNVFGIGLKVFRNLSIRKKNIKITPTQRKRGYDDKGSLRSKEKWLPDFDWSLREQQNDKEKKLDLQQSILDRILKKFENSR